jgi:hypothetical protein
MPKRGGLQSGHYREQHDLWSPVAVLQPISSLNGPPAYRDLSGSGSRAATRFGMLN